MALKDFVTSWRTLVDSAPESPAQQRAAAVARIAELEAERFSVEMAPASLATVIAWHMRSVDTQSATYLRWLQANHYSDEGRAAISGVTMDTGADVNLLMIIQHKPAYPQSAPTINGSVGAHPLAITYFLRDKIKAEIPALVKKFYGDTGGLEPKERAAKLAAIDAEVAGLKSDIAAFDAVILQTSNAIKGATPEKLGQDVIMADARGQQT